MAEKVFPSRTLNGLKRPWGIAINQEGESLVTEGNCVSVFSPSGEKLRSFGSYGSGQGQFDQPHGLAVDGEGNILVSDTKNHCIQKFSAAGQFLAAVGTMGNGRLQFNHPDGIAVNDMVYVADTLNHRIQVLNSASIFGGKGHFMGCFNHPCGVACDSTGNVYVADTSNHRIQVFTADGVYLMMFGRYGHAPLVLLLTPVTWCMSARTAESPCSSQMGAL